MGGAELQSMPEGVQRVAALLRAAGHAHAPVMLDEAARTAEQAAQALGVSLGQIAKSIVFRRKADDAAVLVVTCGDRRVDEKKVAALVCAGQRLGRADADFVKARTGFSIGGVAPLAHATAVIVLLDASLLRFDALWAAAGHPHAVVRLSPQELARLTQAPLADLALDRDEGGQGEEDRRAQAHAIAQVTLRLRALDGAADVASPCISVCRMSAGTALCDGCFRTRDEIAAWGSAGNEGKRRIWRAIEQRMQALQA